MRKLLKNLKPHKATGPDDISPRFLKEMAEPLTPVLTLIFSASLHQGKAPDDWKEANVSPIFKKGDKSQPANYRPVSLTSVCSKVLEQRRCSGYDLRLTTMMIRSRLMDIDWTSSERCGGLTNQLCRTLHHGNFPDPVALTGAD